MNRISVLMIIALLSLGVIVSCSILKGKDAEGQVKRYLARFETDLQQSDSLAAEHFRTDHSSWALQSALQVLRNQVESPVSIRAMFSQAVITINDSILVSVPVTMTADSVGVASTRLTNLHMTLQQNDTTFVITRWNGEEFYEAFWSYSNAITSGQTANQIRESRGHFYARALELEETYDSVIWFANTEPVHYYYVVSGTWNNYERPPTDSYRMGLVDESGKQIIPMEFDLIGIPGALGEDLIEVKDAHKFGCYKLSTGQQLIPAEYDWIIPYENVFLVKQDTVVGWIDAGQAFHAGYPDGAAEAYIRGFKFLPEQITLSNPDATYLEIPSEQYAAVGYTIPASYYTYFGIFDEIEGGYQAEIFNEEADVEYKEARLSFFEKITGTFSALITEARDAYVYSREGFYDHQKITFMNNSGERIQEHDLGWKGELAFRMVDDTHLEIKITPLAEEFSEYDMMEASDVETNLARYVYFAVAGDQEVTPLESTRRYACTEFVKLDSSYLTGDFRLYNTEDRSTTNSTFVSNETLTKMRNEILAGYGYIFQDEEVLNSFKYNDAYNPRYATVADFQEELSEIDRHNLIFFEKILGPVDNSAAFL
jgi:hypothetical protein